MRTAKTVTILDTRSEGRPVTLDQTYARTVIGGYVVLRVDFKKAIRLAKKNREGGSWVFILGTLGYRVLYSLEYVCIGCYKFEGKNRTALLKWAGLKAR